MDELKRKIVEAIQGSVYESDDVSASAHEEAALRAAISILAIPEIAEALSFKIPDEWPLEGDYGRGWNDCRRHAKAIIVS
jgi:hypothetical protein